MPYSDLALTHVPATGNVAPAAWGTQIRTNFEFLIDPPACSVLGSSAQSVANDTLVILNAGSETFDNDGMHSTVTNNSRITAQTAGRYLINTVVEFAANAASYNQVDFLKNGATTLPGTRLPPVTTGAFPTALAITETVVLAAGDYVEVRVRHTAGGTIDVTLAQFNALFMTR